jgi:putative ATP-binding cassette transporter
MELIAYLRRESSADPRPLVTMTLLGALSTLLVIALVSFGAAEARQGESSLRVVAIFLAAVGLFVVSQNSVMSGCAREAEELIRRLRDRLFERVRQSDYPAVDALGRATLHTALAHETQSLSRAVTLLAIAAQQVVTLVFVALFLAWLSWPAFALGIAFGGFAILVHARRSRTMTAITDQAAVDERRLFEGLGHVLNGLKEVRVNALWARHLVSDLATTSEEARLTKSRAKLRWAVDFALIQVMFYLLLGLMVFAVPLFDDEFADVALEATTVALFMIGPISAIAQAVPVVAETEASLARIEAIEHRLQAATDAHSAEDTEALDAPIREIALEDVAFTYREADGSPGFTAGPLSAGFRAGEITFVTGGNGSGKSTMLRLLIGLLRPDRGRILVNGRPLSQGQRQAYRDSIAAVLSDYHLFRRLYGLGNVDEARAEALLRRLEIAHKTGIRDGCFTTTDLSGGQRKRLALLVALLEDKPVLVLDEWAADQDPGFRRVFYEELLPGLRRSDRIIVCVTHDDRYFGACDRVLDMDEGRFRQPPTPAADLRC